MKVITDTTWGSVFAGWRERESTNPGWIDCATRIKGWPDWESWRRFSSSLVKADTRAWQIFRFENPAQEIGQMLIGPYSGWQKNVLNKNETTFAEFLNIRENLDLYSQHDGILAIMKRLPFVTEFIGLLRADGRIVCLDGHHRAVAITLAAKLGREIDYSNVDVKIALAKLNQSETELLNEVLLLGSSNKK